MKIEQEARFYFPETKLDELLKKLEKYKFHGRFFESTIMYDNPNPEYSFYSEEIDGRLRLRFSENTKENEINKGLVTWKKRIKKFMDADIRHEEEVEFEVAYKDKKVVIEMFEKVLKCPRVSSYDRYRNYFSASGLEITLDEFPYGLMIEFEAKGESGSKEIERGVSEFGIDITTSSPLSCDDKYRELCEKSGVRPKQNIQFEDEEMPSIEG